MILKIRGGGGGVSLKPRFPKMGNFYSFTFRKRSALLITETELKLIAAAAMIGLSSNPNLG